MADFYESIKDYSKFDPAFAEEIDPSGYFWGARTSFDWKKLCENYLATCDLDDPCAQITALNAILEAAAAFDAHALY